LCVLSRRWSVLSLHLRPEVETFSPGVHGGPDYSELQYRGLKADRILDFSVCCNPYPPPRTVRESLRRMPLGRYPDSTSAELKNKLSRLHGIPSANILIGSGTTELIRLIALTFLGKGDAVVLFQPSYGEYATAARLAGAAITECKGLVQNSFNLQAEKIAAVIRQNHPGAVFICNPNNPTGQYLSEAEIEAILAECRDTLLVLDEAYVNFVEQPWPSLDLGRRENVVILRSMTKDYGLAGLRLGYIVASEKIIRILGRICPPWNVNVAAQQAGSSVLDCHNYLSRSLVKLRRAGQYLQQELTKLGLPPMPSRANFFLVKVGDGKRLRALLLNEGILVRDCASFGLPEYMRLAPRSLQDCRVLIAVLKRLKRDGKI
jgi:histidinol-phosphate aminotransferase